MPPRAHDFRYENATIVRRFGELLEHLRIFRMELISSRQDDIGRFECLCEAMFVRFSCQDVRATPHDAPPTPNLDTGDPCHAPFSPFLGAFEAEAHRLAFDSTHYYGPDAAPQLEEAFRRFAAAQNMPDLSSSAASILPCVGTVQGYDTVCRVLVQRPADTIAVPNLGYGFFLTQPARAGGRVLGIPCQRRGEVDPEEASRAIRSENVRLWQAWKRNWRSATRSSLSMSRFGTNDSFGCDDNKDATLRIAEVLHEMEPLSEAPYAWRDRALQDRLVATAQSVGIAIARERLVAAVRPPCVRGYLHIQPAVSGHIYNLTAHLQLSKVLATEGVTPIEDIAYHSIRCRLSDLPRLAETHSGTITLLGLSKPMGIASVRIGVLVAPKDRFEAIRRCSEATIGFVSIVAQRALAGALQEAAVASKFSRYTDSINHGRRGYRHKHNLFMRLCFGVQPVQADQKVEATARELVNRCLLRDPGLVRRADEFLDFGLGRWLKPLTYPDAGFFQLVSCTPLIQLQNFHDAGISSSFDVFALLSSLFDLRTIPEEAMAPAVVSGTVLRMSFSPDLDFIAQRLMIAHAGLSDIEDYLESEGTRERV